MRDAARRVFRYPRKTTTSKRGKRLFSVPAKEGPSWSHPYHSVVGEGAGRNPLSLTRGDRSIHAHLSPEQEFSLALGKRTERACVRLEPNVCWAVRSSRPVRKPMIRFTRGLIRIGWIAPEWAQDSPAGPA